MGWGGEGGAFDFAALVALLFFGLFFGLFGFRSLTWIIGTGIALAIQIAFDFRLAYLSIGTALVFFFVRVITQKNVSFVPIYGLLAACIVPLFLHAYWILPLIIFRESATSGLGGEYLNVDALSFFSFADFSHAMAWLHPNWPENIFGKTYFLKPEFLLLPILVYGSLLFAKKPKAIIYFALLGLLGVFLAKGVNPPLGSVYRLLFEHLPGFVMFRDPTKFYTFISISYSMLIAFTLSRVQQVVFGKWKRAANFLPFIAIGLWVVLLFPAFRGNLKGTFQMTAYPDEYKKLTNLLASSEKNTRTFWIPVRSRFGYFSYMHPAIEASFVLADTDIASVSAWLARADTSVKLARQRVKYVIVPFDSEKEIFVSDRRYDANVEKTYHTLLSSTPWLTRVSGLEDLTVMENPMIYPYVWEEGITDSSVEPLSITIHRQTDIDVIKEKYMDSVVVLSERYDPLWTAVSPLGEIGSKSTWDNLNSFEIPSGWSSFTLTYKPQRYVDIGVWISLVTFSGIVGYYVVITLWHTKHQS